MRDDDDRVQTVVLQRVVVNGVVVLLRVFAGPVAMMPVRRRGGGDDDVFRIVVAAAFRQEGLCRLFGRRGYRVGAAPGFDVWMDALHNFHQNQRDATDETEHRGVL